MESTSDRLKKLMKERRLRQVDIVRLVEPYCREYNLTLSKSDMSQFVNGKVVPGQWKLTLLGKALNVSEAWLMGLDVPMERERSDEHRENQDENEANIVRIFAALTAENKTKLIEYGTLLLGSQNGFLNR